MMDGKDLFFDASLKELKQGFTKDNNNYICLLCGKKIEKGIIYPDGGVYYEAGRYIRIHIEKEHQSVFEYLINLDKKQTGLSDHQNSLLRLFYQGKTDHDIQKEMGIGSSSTIRNHRFVLKEKEHQAKVFLVLMELLKDKDKRFLSGLPRLEAAGMVNNRYSITQEESEKILKKYFPEGTDGPLKTFSMKEKSRLVVLKELTKRFESKRFYTEKEINTVLKTAYHDFVTLRRYLIEYGFMERKPDGSSYWLKHDLHETNGEIIDKKKVLKQQYNQIKNNENILSQSNTALKCLFQRKSCLSPQ